MLNCNPHNFNEIKYLRVPKPELPTKHCLLKERKLSLRKVRDMFRELLHILQPPPLIMSSHGFFFPSANGEIINPCRQSGVKVSTEYQTEQLKSYEEALHDTLLKAESNRIRRCDDPTVISQIPCQLLLTQLRHNFNLIYTPQELIMS